MAVSIPMSVSVVAMVVVALMFRIANYIRMSTPMWIVVVKWVSG